MVLRHIIFIVIFLILIATSSLCQSKEGGVHLYELMQDTSMSMKVYKTTDYEQMKIPLPLNYMIVKKPQEGTIYIWEFPVTTDKGATEQKQEQGSEGKKEITKETKQQHTSLNIFDLLNK